MTHASRAALPGCFAVVLAGGQGSRLHELTADTCKPAVPFAGGRRIVDWTLGNLARARPDHALIATQYKPAGLVDHLQRHWQRDLAVRGMTLRDGPSVTGRAEGYVGTADAVTRNLDLIKASDADTVLVVAADHVYDMDYVAMRERHRAHGRPVTVAVDRVPLDQARAFGVMAADAHGHVLAFDEKPSRPRAMPGRPDTALVSMGIYVFDRDWLIAALRADDGEPGSAHDFGHSILPPAVAQGEVAIHDPAADNPAFFWRDVGSLDALRQTCIDIHSGAAPCPLPAYPSGRAPRDATMVLPGGTVVLPGGRVRRGARLRNAIVAPGTVVPHDLTAGFDADRDARYFRVTPGGTVLITARMLARRMVDNLFRVPATPLFSSSHTDALPS